jgi:hypothetical protein
MGAAMTAKGKQSSKAKRFIGFPAGAEECMPFYAKK